MTQKTVSIPDMSCGHCLGRIQKAVQAIAGVKSVQGDPASKQVSIAWGEPADWESIEKTLQEAGYPPR